MLKAGKKIIVIKRDGAREEFNPDKLIQVAEAAGLELPKAVQLAQSIKEWINKLNRKQVTSIEIRDRVQEVLLSLDRHVGDLFRWYQKTKD